MHLFWGLYDQKSTFNDHAALNIPQHRNVKLNELPKQIFMLLPLLLLLLLLLYVLHHVLI